MRNRVFRADRSSLIIVIALAGGIAASSAGLALVRSVILLPLPVRAPHSLIIAWPVNTAATHGRSAISLRDMTYIREGSRTIEELAAVHEVGARGVAATFQDRQIPLNVANVTGNLFRVLGVPPRAGRLLMAADDESGDGPVIVISEAFWRRELGADPSVVGQLIQIGPESHAIVGIAPARFDFPKGAEGWVSMLGSRPELRGDPEAAWAVPVARLRAHVSLSEARADFAAVLARARGESESDPPPVVVRSFSEEVLGDFRTSSILLWAAGLLVLLVSAINVAGLSLSRFQSRRYELTLRAALGATRGRLIRDMALESSVLGIFGAVLGTLLAHVILRWTRETAPPTIAEALPSGGVDYFLLVSVAVLVALAFPIFGLWPAVVATRDDIEPNLRVGQRTISRRRGRFSNEGTVVAQVAFAVIAGTTAGLLVRSLDELQSDTLGYDVEELVIVGVQPVAGSIRSIEEYRSAIAELLRTLDESPRLRGATTAMGLPASGGGASFRYWTEESTAHTADEAPRVDVEIVAPDHFRVMSIPLVRGRGFASSDTEATSSIAVVSASFASENWNENDPVGQRLRTSPTGEWIEVVGVAADTRYRDLLSTRPTVYLPLAQVERLIPSFLVARTRSSASSAVPYLRNLVREADPRLAIRLIRSGEELLAEPLAHPRFLARTMSGLGIAAIVLALAGLIALVARALRRRRSEFAIRSAVGASPVSLGKVMLRYTFTVTGIGIAAGVCISLVISRSLRSVLYNVSPDDLLAYIVASTTVGVLVLAVSLYVAWRAASTDPMLALRHD